MKKNSNQILRALIREILEEDVGEVTVTRGPRKMELDQTKRASMKRKEKYN